jgi:hypothetical protein
VLTLRRRLPLVVGVTVLTLAALLPSSALAANLPAAGTDMYVVTGSVSVTNRLGSETVLLAGSATVVRQAAHMDGAVEVVDMEITALSLSGQSSTGTITVTKSASPASTGEIRGLAPPPNSFPASSFFDVYADVTVPASPGGTIVLHNTIPIHLPVTEDIYSWPPNGKTFGGSQSGSGQCTANPPFGPPASGGILLIPAQPACTYVTSASFTLSGAVGGVTELANAEPSYERRRGDDDGGIGVRSVLIGVAVVSILIVTVWFGRRRLAE